MTWLAFFALDIDILYGQKIIFEDVKSAQLEQQIKFNGMPFVVLGCKNMDCTHSKDHAILRKRGGQGSITEICNWIFTLLLQIFPGEVLFSYHPSFSLPLETFYVRKVWNKPINSFKMPNRIITERP